MPQRSPTSLLIGSPLFSLMLGLSAATAQPAPKPAPQPTAQPTPTATSLPRLTGKPLNAAARRGQRVMRAAECHRCHRVSDPAGENRGLPPIEQRLHCVDCHTWILSSRDDPALIESRRAEYPLWDRYLRTIVHFTRLPDLGHVARRVDPTWLRAFLDAPHDLRPHLDESMIPVRLSKNEKDDVVAYLVALAGEHAVVPGAAAANPQPPPHGAAVREGAALFLAKGCATCHLIAGRPAQPTFNAAFYAAMKPRAQLAPDLVHARARVPRDRLIAFLRAPEALEPDTTMPNFNLSDQEATRLADYLLSLAPAAPASAPDATTPLSADAVPLLDRPVPWDEVNAAVFGAICVHCHMDPALNDGDGGPGNVGGLGFGGVRLVLEHPEGIRTGLQRAGKRVDVLRPERPGEPPLLLAALLRRHTEARRDHRPLGTAPDLAAPATSAHRPGMPLGLPPLSVEQLSLVKTWIAQGAPGPP